MKTWHTVALSVSGIALAGLLGALFTDHIKSVSPPKASLKCQVVGIVQGFVNGYTQSNIVLACPGFSDFKIGLETPEAANYTLKQYAICDVTVPAGPIFGYRYIKDAKFDHCKPAKS